MKLTSKKVQRDVRDLLLESDLAKAIDGGVYHAGTRPRDSRAEDADLQRVEEIEELARAFVRSLTAGRSCYSFRLLQTIHSVAEPSINQHFVVVKLAYRYYDGVED